MIENIREIKDEIYKFLSKHEMNVAEELKDYSIMVNFSKYGNRAGCRALFEVIQALDDDNKQKALEMMKNKKVLDLLK